jgi:hypothetical protein
MFTSPGVPPPPPLDDEAVEADEGEDEEAEDEFEDVESAVDVKGLELLPPAAFWRLRVVVPYWVCCETLALTLSESIAEPVL